MTVQNPCPMMSLKLKPLKDVQNSGLDSTLLRLNHCLRNLGSNSLLPSHYNKILKQFQKSALAIFLSDPHDQMVIIVIKAT